MTNTSRYSLARRLLRDAERADISPATQALLFAAATSVACDVIRDERTPRRHVCELWMALRRAEPTVLEPKAVH